MGLFKPVHSEYSDDVFKVFLLFLSTFFNLRSGETLAQARYELDRHKAVHYSGAPIFSLDKQVKSRKRDLHRKRNQIAREAQGREWTSEGLREFALKIFNERNALARGDATIFIRRENELMEKIAILEICDELGIDLFDGECQEQQGQVQFNTWSSFTFEKDGFMAYFPCVPDVVNLPNPSLPKGVATSYSSAHGSLIVSILVIEYPKGFTIDALPNPREMFEQSAMSVKDNPSTTVTIDSINDFRGYLAAQAKIVQRFDNGTTTRVSLRVLKNLRLYAFTVEDSSILGESNKPKYVLEKFTESLQFIDK